MSLHTAASVQTEMGKMLKVKQLAAECGILLALKLNLCLNTVLCFCVFFFYSFLSFSFSEVCPQLLGNVWPAPA